MRALISQSAGAEHLKVKDVATPSPKENEVLIRVVAAGVNPVDNYLVETETDLRPEPYIAGSEFAGVVEKLGPKAKRFEKGDRVTVYSWLFDSRCDMCASGREMVCRKGGMIGEHMNGGYSEYAIAPEQNVFKIPDRTKWDVAASLPIAGLTPYQGIKEACLQRGETLTVYGASGNTGMFATQIGKSMGAKVIAVSSKKWLTNFGADFVIKRKDAAESVKNITKGRMSDVVIDTPGKLAWQHSLDSVGSGGRMVVFGGWLNYGGGTGFVVNLDVQTIYNRHAKIIGSTGGTIKNFKEVVGKSDRLKVKVWKRFKLDDAYEAFSNVYSDEKDGRIMIEP
jgi:NADPH:quinone reductase-like Zn-dependent oxidoreductase